MARGKAAAEGFFVMQKSSEGSARRLCGFTVT